MPQRFYYEGLYEDTTWTVLYENAQGYAEKFLDYCKRFIEASNFPNLEVEYGEFVTGGVFFNRESTPMVVMRPRQSQVKQLAAHFRAQQFGNVVIYSCLETINRGLFDVGLSGAALHAKIRSHCKNMAQWEEFTAIDSLANLVFYKAVEQFDPHFRENKLLLSKI